MIKVSTPHLMEQQSTDSRPKHLAEILRMLDM
jgi:hypothetical protein